MANQWFKFYGAEYLSDPKIERLNPVERCCWITLMCLASNSTEEGRIEYLTTESLLNKSGVQYDPYNPELWESSLSVLKKFENMKMVDLYEDGTIIIKNWNKRQERNLTSAERVAKHRAKKKEEEECNENVTTDVTNVTLEENRIEENRIDSSSETKSKISYNEDDLKLSRLLIEKIKENIPTFKEPDIESWANHVRLMRERDDRTYQKIEYIINWAQSNEFWKPNIMSTKKLREKFDTLVGQAKRDITKQQAKKPKVI